MAVLGRAYTQKELLLRSLELGPEVYRVWKNLCMLLDGESGETAMVNGVLYTKKSCDEHAETLQ